PSWDFRSICKPDQAIIKACLKPGVLIRVWDLIPPIQVPHKIIVTGSIQVSTLTSSKNFLNQEGNCPETSTISGTSPTEISISVIMLKCQVQQRIIPAISGMI